MDFIVKDADGNQSQTSTQDILDSMRADGANVLQHSPDGMQLVLNDNDGQQNYNVHAFDYLKSKGYDLVSATPDQKEVDYGHVDPALRASVSALPDDGLRRFYLERHFKQQGMENPQVVGNGRTWHVYNPQTNKWLGVTNDPNGWGMADLAEGAVSAPRILGAALGGGTGGLAGLFTGPAAIAAGAVGAGAGGAGGQALTHLGMAAIDPEFAKIAEEHPEAFNKELRDVGLTDAVFGAIPPALRQSVLGRFISAPVSSMAKGVGGVAEPAGELLGTTAKLANQGPISRMVGTGFTPGIGPMQNAGMLFNTPRDIVKWLSRGAGSAEEALGKVANRFPGYGAKQAAARAAQGAENFMGPMSLTAEEAAAPSVAQSAAKHAGRMMDVAGDLGDQIVQGTEGLYNAGMKGVAKTGDLLREGGGMLKNFGDTMKPFEPYIYGEPITKGYRDRYLKQQYPGFKDLPPRQVGRTI